MKEHHFLRDDDSLSRVGNTELERPNGVCVLSRKGKIQKAVRMGLSMLSVLKKAQNIEDSHVSVEEKERQRKEKTGRGDGGFKIFSIDTL